MAFDLNLEFILSGKPQRVMQLLTDAALIRKWSGDEAILENKTGGKVELFNDWVTGKVLKTSGNELAYTWKASNWPEEAKPSEVHYLLQADEAGTKVTVRHTGLPSEEEMEGHRTGWTDFFFEPMEDYIMAVDRE